MTDKTLGCGFLCVATAVMLVLAGPAASQSEPLPAKPNIVYVMADDLGWTDLGCQGSRYYETPHIDRLATQGVTFTDYHVCQNCAPTRAALISGQYAPRTGIYTVNTFLRGKEADRKMVPPLNSNKLPLDKITLAQALKRNGYATGMFGKWHLGKTEAHHPARRGFDEAISSNGRHFNFRTDPAQKVDKGVYLADFLTDKAVDFIDRHKKHPFFLYLPHFAVHTPLQAKPELIERYKQKKPVKGHNHPTYAAMIHSVDESVGRIMAKLDELGLAENTLLIFTSDNGGLGGYSVPGKNITKGTTDNAPLREGKGSLYEGGVRVPFLARWPAVIEAGSRCDERVAHIDMYPTFVELAGGDRDQDYLLDGVSVTSLLRDPGSSLPSRSIYYHFPGYLQGYISEAMWRTTPVSTILRGRYKLLEFFEDARFELYDLHADIGERKNLAATHPEKVKRLHADLVAWRQRVDAAMARMKTAEELAHPEELKQRKRRKTP